MANIPSRSELHDTLVAAAASHHDYQQHVLGGVRDEHWSGFYAAYALGRLGDFTAASELAQLLEQAPAGDDWTTSATAYVLKTLSK